MAESQFDVFLCHNSEDKPAVIEIAQQLKQNNLKPWLDVWELQPGAIWQFALEQQIESIGAVAVFVGQQGLGPWQSEEIYAFLQEFIKRGCPVIPVMLPGTPQQPKLPVFLRNRHWVDFRMEDPNPLSQLVWGITRKKHEESLKLEKVTEISNTFSIEEFSESSFENESFNLDVTEEVIEDHFSKKEEVDSSGEWKSNFILYESKSFRKDIPKFWLA
ncbi:MAG: toll/interleukin-1 receptor domain-containing protein [Leptolyngbyaceae cyanobacterium]